jgi:5S rRNA maturation endonuclease (ribonuclease M5)
MKVNHTPEPPSNLHTVGYRGIEEDVAKFYGITTSFNDNGKAVSRIYPYPHKDKVRILPKDFTRNKGFTTDHLFGMDKFNAGSSKVLTIVEGEDDAAAAYQMLGCTFPVVSLPGAKTVRKVLQNPKAYSFIKSHQSIVIATDSDEVGEEAAEALQRSFPGRCYRVNMSKYKDACEYLEKGATNDFKYSWINRTKYVPDNIFCTTEQFEKIIRDDQGSMYIPTGISDFDEAALGLMQGHFTLFQAPEGIGKQLPDTTPIPTPSGFKPMGDIKVGDTIFGADGKTTRVTYVTPTQHDIPCYRVEFSDGTSQVAGGPHRWGVYTTDNTYKVKTTEEILSEGVTRGEGVALYSVPITKPVEYPESNLEVDPYTLGMWLGDGHSASQSIFVGYSDADQFEDLFQVDRKKEEETCINYWVKGLEFKNIRSLGLVGNKHIPDEYLFASVEQRSALLQGLMDSDGSTTGVGCEFYTSKISMAEDFLKLARSLGYKCRIRVKELKVYGVPKGTCYTVWFLAHGERPVFRYKRKQEKVKYCSTFRATRKTIRNIVPVESVPSRCLTVDNSDHLYLCGEHYTVTHNTELMRMLEANLLKNHPTVPFASMHMEETKKRGLLGLASYMLEKDVTLQDTENTTNADGDEEIVYLPSYKGTPEEEVLDAIRSFTERENFYQFTLSVDDDPMSILEQIRYFSEVCGCKYVFFEPIQDLGYSRQTDATLESWLSELATKLARLASELGIGIVSIAHENDDGQIRDCRMLGKRASVVVKLERDKDSTDTNISNTTSLKLLKNRPVGPTTFAGMLEFDPDSFTLSEKTF